MPKSDPFSRLSGVPEAYFAKMSEDVPDGDQDALRVFLALRVAARRIERAVAMWLDRSGLTPTKLDVLHLLRSSDGMSVTRMSEFLRMTQPNLTFVVNGLERDGLVARAASAADRRTTVVRLSPAGEKLIVQVTPRHMYAIAAAAAELSKADREQLIEALAKLADGFEQTPFEH